MRKLSITFKGTDPILMHDCKCVNPLHPISIELKKLTGLRGKNKTDEVLARISDLEFMGGLYWDDAVGVHVPAENIARCIEDGAKAMKRGKDIVRYVNIVETLVPLDYGPKKTLEELCAGAFCVRCGTRGICFCTRTTARRPPWSCTSAAGGPFHGVSGS